MKFVEGLSSLLTHKGVYTFQVRLASGRVLLPKKTLMKV